MKSIIILILLFITQLNCFSQQWKNWNTANSSIPTNYSNAMAIDANNNVWLATYQGVIKFDTHNWTTYNTSNSPLPSNVCNSIATDGDTVWIGTVFG
jgi:ligand-binding sensor domain-containing protein